MNRFETFDYAPKSELASFFNRIETDRSFYAPVKEKRRWDLQLFQWTFGITEGLFPKKAQQWGAELFFTPLKNSLSVRERSLLQLAEVNYCHFDGEDLPVYTWKPKSNTRGRVLVVHGWGGKSTDFYSFISPLTQQGFEVVAFDGPAHGNSSKKQTSLPELSSFLVEVARKLDSVDVVIGHSLGGSVVFHALQNGLLAKKLVIINNPAHPEGLMQTFLTRINASAAVGNYIRNTIIHQFGSNFESLCSISTAEDCHIPTLVVHDKHDKEAPILHMEALQPKLPQARYLVTEKLGHKRILRDNELIEHVLSFIEEV